MWKDARAVADCVSVEYEVVDRSHEVVGGAVGYDEVVVGFAMRCEECVRHAVSGRGNWRRRLRAARESKCVRQLRVRGELRVRL